MTTDLAFGAGHSFAREAAHIPDRPAIIAADLELSYGQLWRISCGFAVSMEAAGVDRTSLVAVETCDMVAAVATLLAASLLGAGYVMLDDAVVSGGVLRPTHFFRSPDVAPRPNVPALLMDANWPRAAAATLRYDPSAFPMPDDAREFWYTHTSGTTGQPKYMSLTHGQFLARARAMAEDFGDGRGVFCSLFPCHTRVFLVRAIAALLSRTTIVDTLDLDFMRQNSVKILLGSPRTVLDWLGGRTLSPPLDVLQVTGARLQERDIGQLLESFRVLEDVYGASETSKAYKNIYSTKEGQRTVSGKRLDSEVEIVKGDVSDTSGLVRVRNTYTTTGYLNAPEATGRMFREGWFYSGDIGRWGPNGTLLIEGRNDEVINLGGAKVNPLDIERVIAEVSGVTSAFVGRDLLHQQPPSLAALITVRDLADAQVIAQRAIEACVSNLPGHAVPHRLFAVAALPKTSDGENKRRDCEAMLKLVLARHSENEKGSAP